ncbi:hypothetical protein [Massilia pseudoviolaceinigra]|uniref:hypothetical protein n=1 Tax=Massilia pseudoviolaceinigra TaxID=3057165 RepID=UPI0027964ED4|nr:hypothetical protein [Massilia sp. CCM 9206]MDQ1922184.1 hypothetical protein [Massilia sp. CCM 9206]
MGEAHPQYSDREVIQESEYDWSCVSGYLQSDETVENYLKRFQQEWDKTKICPNPGVYVIENSDWDGGLDRERFDLKHFLILGDFCFIEILAKNCTWVSEGNIAA